MRLASFRNYMLPSWASYESSSRIVRYRPVSLWKLARGAAGGTRALLEVVTYCRRGPERIGRSGLFASNAWALIGKAVVAAKQRDSGAISKNIV